MNKTMGYCLSAVIAASAVALGPYGLAHADTAGALETRTALDTQKHARIPTIESMWMRSHERMTLAFDAGMEGEAAMQVEEHGMLSGGIALGLAYPVTSIRLLDEGGEGGLYGHTRVGVGVLFARGDVPLGVEQDLALRLPLSTTLSVSAGVSAAVRLISTDIDTSRWELAVPIELRWRSLALVYRPGVSGALAGEERQVFAGEMTRQARPGVDLLYVAARLYVDALGF